MKTIHGTRPFLAALLGVAGLAGWLAGPPVRTPPTERSPDSLDEARAEFLQRVRRDLRSAARELGVRIETRRLRASLLGERGLLAGVPLAPQPHDAGASHDETSKAILLASDYLVPAREGVRPVGSAVSGYLLRHAEDGDQIELLRASGEVVASLPLLGVGDPDWTRVYASVVAGLMRNDSSFR